MKITNLRVTLAIALVALLATPLAAIEASGAPVQNQSLAQGWTRLSPEANPPYRIGTAMTYDAPAGYVLLFGGAGSTALLNDTWAFQGGDWTQLHPSVSPPARFGAGMAYDASDGYVVLFGGLGPSWFNDTWEFRGGQWTQLHPSESPSAREYPSMAYDPDLGSVILFGGNGPTSPGNDTWAFNGGQWRQLHPSGSPPAAFAPSFVFDKVTGTIVMFGGSTSGPLQYLNETWEFNGATWAQLHPGTSPPSRIFAGGAYDATDGYIVLFSGSCYNTPNLCDNTTWLFDGTDWSRYTPPGASPNSTEQGFIAYDPAAGYVVLFENATSSLSSNLSATWAFVGPSAPTESSTFLGLPVIEGYLLIGAVASAAAAVSLVILYARRGRRRDGVETSDSTDKPEPQSPPP